jgi:alcohol oxidase
MAPKDQKGVVDKSLSVHGIKNLKLADLSIPPENVGANTGGTAFVVGERAADIFIKELGLGSTAEKRRDSGHAESAKAEPQDGHDQPDVVPVN